MQNLNNNCTYTESFYKFILENLDELSHKGYVLLKNHKLIFANQFFYKETGIPSAENKIIECEEFIPQYALDLFKKIGSDTYNTTYYNIPFKKPNNDLVYFDVIGRSFVYDENSIRLLELTNTKEDPVNYNNNLFSYILKSLSENIIIINKEGLILKIIKQKEQHKELPVQINELFSNNAVKEVKKHMAIGISKNIVQFEFQNYKNTFEAKMVPFSNEEFVFTYNEISLRKRIENKFIDSQIKLKQLNKEKDLLMSIIAHDLKNPFNIINGFCSLLLNSSSKFNENKLREMIELIYSASTSGHNLLENLLEWAKTQSDQSVYKPEVISLNEIIDHIINFYSINIVNKKLILENTTPTLQVFADKNMLSTVLRNLISNAIKFTPEKGTIYINSMVTNDNSIEITVQDSGVGLSENQMNNLFKVGANNSSKGTNGEKGSGLGLLLCKEFVEKQKGNIKVNSKKGEGSKFTITLPKAP